MGRPLAALLANDGATVYSVDIDSIYVMQRGRMVRTDKTQENACLESDVIVLGVPSKAYKLNPAWISPNTMIVNVASFKVSSARKDPRYVCRLLSTPSSSSFYFPPSGVS